MNISGVSPMQVLRMLKKFKGTLKHGALVAKYRKHKGVVRPAGSGSIYNTDKSLLFLLEDGEGKRKTYKFGFGVLKRIPSGGSSKHCHWEVDVTNSTLRVLDRNSILVSPEHIDDESIHYEFVFDDDSNATEFHTKTMVLLKKKKESPRNMAKGRSRKSGGYFGRLFGGEMKTQRHVISAPRNFSHGMHIGIPDQGFVHENLPKEWQTIFAEAGISKEQYEDPENARRMMKAIKKFKNGRTQKKVKRKKPQRHRGNPKRPPITPRPRANLKAPPTRPPSRVPADYPVKTPKKHPVRSLNSRTVTHNDDHRQPNNSNKTVKEFGLDILDQMSEEEKSRLLALLRGEKMDTRKQQEGHEELERMKKRKERLIRTFKIDDQDLDISEVILGSGSFGVRGN